ncbi:patatin-like phospholipase family protein [Bradyrhizobium prioriisuperbiae]|uniref:patatin-like phospholipase family protein n=1 Tax=Bradyrhizobium prioriisuperbiae TaxID=2854389 RepID=UPI0028EC54E5|nr:patatin-like phospholipase family protein [Bradyrhizobium prioritasuperba]
MSEPNGDNQHRHDLLQTILKGHFASDDAELIASIKASAEFIDLPSGATLFRQDDHSDDVYFVLSGRLRAFADTKGGSKILGEIGRGETVGELALFTGEPRSASVIALRDSSLVKVTRQVVERTLARSPQVALQMTRIVINRFRRSERERQTPIAPINICILAISSGVDAVALAKRLRAAGRDSATTHIVGPDDIARQFGGDAASAIKRNHDAVAYHVDEIEAASKAVYLIADSGESAWTQFCLQNCDEVMLVGDARQTPELSHAERHYLAGETPISIARQTLVLLHGAETRSPTGTVHWLKARRVSRHVHIRPELARDMRRLARIISGNAVGLVLAGGGARGFAHIGVMKALEEAGIEADFIGGTSIGAIMGTCLALDQSAEKIAIAVHKAFLRHPKGNITGDYNLIPLVSLIKGKRTHDAMREAIATAAGADIDAEDTWKTFFVIGSDFSTSSEAVLDRGNLARNVIASYAIPGVLPPMLIGGHLMFDGGMFNNFPVDVMARLGAGQIIGVDLLIEDGHVFEIDQIPGTLAHLRDKLRAREAQRYRLPTMPETMLNSSAISSVPKQKAMRTFVDLLFEPRIERVGLLEWKRYDEIVALGYDHARQKLAAESEERLSAFR